MAKQNPRAVVLAALKAVGRRHRMLASTARWGQGQTLHDGARWRKRTEAEKIEHNLNAWYELRAEAGNMIADLAKLDELACREIERLRLDRSRAA